MNALGMLVDLSHVGPKTSRDAILHSAKPVAYTHCAPSSMLEHPRNKTDDELRFIVDRGGFVGYATYPPFMPQGPDSTVEHCVETLEFLVNLVGEDSVGIGTDFTQGQDAAFFDWLSSDKGTGRRLIPQRPGGVTVMPEGLRTIGEFPNLTRTMLARGWPEETIRKVMGENWLGFLKEVWGIMPFNGFEGARNFEELGSQIQAAVAREVNFDRFNVGLLDLDAYEFIDAYVYGRNVPGRQTGHRRTLKGTVVEAALASGGVFAGSDDVEAMVSRFPDLDRYTKAASKP